MRTATAHHGFLQRQLVLLGLLATICSTIALVAGTADVDISGNVQVAGKKHPNAVVWLESKTPQRHGGPRPVMDQSNLRFSPRVLAVQTGTSVEFPNNDRVFHNVFSFHDGKQFDLGLYPIGARMASTRGTEVTEGTEDSTRRNGENGGQTGNWMFRRR